MKAFLHFSSMISGFSHLLFHFWIEEEEVCMMTSSI